MKTLILNDAQHALLVSLLQGDILETEQMIYDYQEENLMVTKAELQECLAQSEELLKLVEGV
uniref:Uncharacterized protein n=2 Tax=unclassified bacterial viruses TaxID=12333 RepID=A0AAU6VZN5_9VIRU